MYIPEAFKNTNLDEARQFIRANPFAVICTHGAQIHASHLPLVLHEYKETWYLLGHCAKSNKQAKKLDGADVLCIFSGKHSYISAAWYQSNDDVPSWNYQACHVRGQCRKISDSKGVMRILTSTIKFFESHNESPWKMGDCQSEYISAFLKQITCFEIKIENIEFAEKLSQDKKHEEVLRVQQQLNSSKNPFIDNKVSKRMLDIREHKS